MLFESTHYCILEQNGDAPAEGKPASGFTLSRRLFDEEELLLIAVSPQARRQGIGKKLIDKLVSNARENNVGVFYWVDRRLGYALSSADISKDDLLKVSNAVYQQLNP